MPSLIVFAKNRNRNEFGVTIWLPVDDPSWRIIERQLEELSLVLSDDDKARFRADIEYLPRTMEELGNAERIYRETGTDWHTACERARNQVNG